VSIQEFYEQYWRSPYHDPLAEGRHHALWRLVESAGPERFKSFLELGCGEGDLVAEAVARGMRGTGTDISHTVIERAAARHPQATFDVLDVENRPWRLEQNRFDLVVALEVIEHVFAPRTLIEGAFDVLGPCGYLALSTPYHGRVKNILLALRGFDHHFDVEGQHIRFFSDRALARLLTESGFEVVETLHFGRRFPIWANTMMWARKPAR
jgi:SAM-dependent methyltransferase